MIREKTITLPVSEKEITIHAPIVRTIRVAGEKYKTEEKKAIYIAATCCNMTEDEYESLDVLDNSVIGGVIADFLGVEATTSL
jgi:hypothetical protein